MNTGVRGGESQTADVVIVGGGSTGLFTAFYLASRDRNCRIVVVERDPSYSLASTPRASGGVRRLFALPENIALSNFSIPVFEQFSTLMEVDGERPDIAFRKNGYLFIVPPGHLEQLEANLEKQSGMGVRVSLLDPPALKRAFPSMNVDDLAGGVLSPDDGWLDPHATLMALRRKVRDLGVRIVADEVRGIEAQGKLVRAVNLTSGGTLRTQFVVNAAGAWAVQICAMVGMSAPITPLRRFEHYFEAREQIEPLPYIKDVHRLAFRPEGGGYTGGVPTLREPRGYNFDVDHEYFERVVWPALAHRFPQFETTRCKSTISGLYDQNDMDGNPIIGPWLGGYENFIMSAGFSGHGLMHAPGAGLAVAELILDGRFTTLELTGLGWRRIAEGRPYRETGII